MQIKEGVVYLVEPVFGRKVLTGPVGILTTWVDFTFSEKLTPAELGLEEEGALPAQVRVLIPLSNVQAVIIEREEVILDYRRPPAFEKI